MSLPGEPLRVCDNGDLVVFLQDICQATCRHHEYCSIATYAGMYAAAHEWRTVDGQPVCIRHEGLPVVEICTECKNTLIHRNGCLECPVCGSGCEG